MSAVAELRAVGFEYPEARVAARARAPFSLREVSLEVGAGEIVGVIGPNASGKTTLIRLLSGLLRPTRGAVLLEGRPLAQLTRAAVATRVGVVPQDVPRDFPYTVEQLVLMGRFPHAPGRFFESAEDRRIATEAMALVGVRALAAERCDRLSGGERQRVMLARALAQEPRLLVLDEPTAHLDLRYQVECVGLLRRLNAEAGLSVVVVSHDLDLAGHLCDRLLLLSEGRAVRQGPPDLVLDAAALEAAYGCPVTVERHPVTGRPIVHVVWPDPATTRGR
jgi:iron complex transport system ATP-binding protein